MTRLLVYMLFSVLMAILQYKMADFICKNRKSISFLELYLTIIVAMVIGLFVGTVLNSINF